jgi:hypothetical protein
MTTLSVIESIHINRPASEVFKFISNPANSPLWVSGVTTMELRPGGPLGVGSTGYQERPVLGRKLTAEWKIIEFKPPKDTQPKKGTSTELSEASSGVLKMEITSGQLKGAHVGEKVQSALSLGLSDTLGKDSCQFTFTAEGKIRGLFGLAAPLMNKMYARQVRHDLTTLKELLELDEKDLETLMKN